MQFKEKKQVNKIAAFLRKKAFRGYRTLSSLSDESFAAPASPRRTKYSVSQSLFTKLHFGSQMVIFCEKGKSTGMCKFLLTKYLYIENKQA